MKFQAIFFVLFALASSFMSMYALVSAEDFANETTTLAPINTTGSTSPPSAVAATTDSVHLNSTETAPPGVDNSTSPTTVTVIAPTTTTVAVTASPTSVNGSADAVNGTESQNSTHAPPQNIVASDTTTTTTTTQAPNGVSVSCLNAWRKGRENLTIDELCQDKVNRNVTECRDDELQILFYADCWFWRKLNSTDVSRGCLKRVNKCVANATLSSPGDVKTAFCLLDRDRSDCFTKGDNSTDCSAPEYQAVLKASDCSSSRRVAEVCTLIVLLASVVALALTSE